MNEWERQRRKAEYLKKAYPPGTRIVLNSMGDDPRPIQSGMRGTVEVVDISVRCIANSIAGGISD